MRHPRALHIRIRTMLKDEKGATMVEYALMVALIATVVFAAVQILGTNLNGEFAIIAGLFP